MWNEHEPSRLGNFTWEGYADFTRFLDLVAAHDLFPVLRIGPYKCGEYYFGGLPLWLRQMDNTTCFRCSDPVWKREMER
jgi:beta-galactosidase